MNARFSVFSGIGLQLSTKSVINWMSLSKRQTGEVYDVASGEFTALKGKLAHDKACHQTFKRRSASCYTGLANRYFYQNGRIRAPSVMIRSLKAVGA
jgi:hypothetical protein